MYFYWYTDHIFVLDHGYNHKTKKNIIRFGQNKIKMHLKELKKNSLSKSHISDILI